MQNRWLERIIFFAPPLVVRLAKKYGKDSVQKVCLPLSLVGVILHAQSSVQTVGLAYVVSNLDIFAFELPPDHQCDVRPPLLPLLST
jgi:hypothetical protein